MELKIVTLLKEIDSIFIDTSPFITNDSNLKKIKEIKVIVLDDIVK